MVSHQEQVRRKLIGFSSGASQEKAYLFLIRSKSGESLLVSHEEHRQRERERERRVGGAMDVI